MKISTALEHGMKIAGVDARESARMLKKAGFDGVDLAICHDQEDPKKILTKEWADVVYEKAEAIRAEGLEIAQCHLPYYPGHLPLPGDGSYEAFEEFALGGLILQDPLWQTLLLRMVVLPFAFLSQLLMPLLNRPSRSLAVIGALLPLPLAAAIFLPNVIYAFPLLAVIFVGILIHTNRQAS